MRYRLASAIVFLLLLTACGGGETRFTPKPRAYPKVVYPKKAYQQFDKDYCAFTFEYPVYAEIQQDTSFFEQLPPHPCWFDLYIPNFGSRLHCSYVPINGKRAFEQLKADAFEMTDWHNKRANYIEEVLIDKPNGVGGMVFLVEGDVASPFQFFLTDTTDHFMRGSLYFNTEARADSLAPVYEFIREDLLHLIETFEWTE